MDLKALRALCDAATDGEWEYWEYKNGGAKVVAQGRYLCRCPRMGTDASEISKVINNARFIAATDPQTVRALIDEIERLRCNLEIADYALKTLERLMGEKV